MLCTWDKMGTLDPSYFCTRRAHFLEHIDQMILILIVELTYLYKVSLL